jgi:hypothetical protein
MSDEKNHESESVAEIALPRYERPHEAASPMEPLAIDALIPREGLEAAIATCSLTPGGRGLVRGLVRLGRPAMFGGGGAGIEYGSLLKTATRPEFLGEHVREVAAHLHERHVDLLMVPGMSGYPVGAMYSVGAGIPAILLKKQKHRPEEDPSAFPPGAFVIPSYTGEGDVVMSADLEAIQDVIDGIVRRQIGVALFGPARRRCGRHHRQGDHEPGGERKRAGARQGGNRRRHRDVPGRDG